ncbi:MAG: hypothetical protein ABF271_11790, partial [Abyssibacter sp.]|uniref:hypothetical protein n=1 Tax=Abyssibacter sp. TaxID=2320200 RepID=UPI003219CDD6
MNQFLAIGAAGVVAASAVFVYGVTDSAAMCPPGMHLADPVAYAREFRADLSPAQAQSLRDQYGEQACLSDKHPEPFLEVQQAQQARSPGVGIVAPGAFRRAVESKQAMLTHKAVAGADGPWVE